MNSLIIKVLGMSVPKQVLFDRVRRMWKPQQPLKVVPLSNEYYIVLFSSKEDRDYAYHEGPWMIDDHYLLVQRWQPNFNPWRADCQRRIAVWVRIPDLPMELSTVESLGIIGNMIGKIIKIDRSTSIYDKGEFARIYVEVDLQKPLLPVFTAFGEDRQLVYEGLHLVCFECGKYGHVKEKCPERLATVGEHMTPVTDGNANDIGKQSSNTSFPEGMAVDGSGSGGQGLEGQMEKGPEASREGKKRSAVKVVAASEGLGNQSTGVEVSNLLGGNASTVTAIGSDIGNLASGQGCHLGPQMLLRRDFRRGNHAVMDVEGVKRGAGFSRIETV
ncbi:hypothetical protein K1719_016055 [Acacia pycnantha]|nr:hypothetical protein K1719_016055 [Acacia pycnantha]